jgi:DNA-binding IclR family transcriptional regulator
LLSQYLRQQYRYVDKGSGVGVVDKTVAVLTALVGGPAPLADLVTRTGLARPTAHRIATALEHHGLVGRDAAGRFVLGPRLAALVGGADADRLLRVAPTVLRRLRDATGESAQLYRRQGDRRVCVAAAERESGLRDTVPVGSELPMTAGSAAQVLLAYAAPDDVARLLPAAAFSASALSVVRRRGWAASVAEREPGVASVSAPVRGPGGEVVAAISVSGPIERLTRSPGRRHSAAVAAAAAELGAALGGTGPD